MGSGEFPAGYTLNAMLDVRNVDRNSVLRLICADGPGEQAALRIGEQTGSSSLQQLSRDQLFLAFDTGKLPAGCSLQAEIDNGRGGRSNPSTLANMLRIPRIDSFVLSDNPSQSMPRPYSADRAKSRDDRADRLG
jgi:hypothetical protein